MSYLRGARPTGVPGLVLALDAKDIGRATPARLIFQDSFSGTAQPASARPSDTGQNWVDVRSGISLDGAGHVLVPGSSLESSIVNVGVADFTARTTYVAGGNQGAHFTWRVQPPDGADQFTIGFGWSNRGDLEYGDAGLGGGPVQTIVHDGDKTYVDGDQLEVEVISGLHTLRKNGRMVCQFTDYRNLRSTYIGFVGALGGGTVTFGPVTVDAVGVDPVAFTDADPVTIWPDTITRCHAVQDSVSAPLYRSANPNLVTAAQAAMGGWTAASSTLNQHAQQLDVTITEAGNTWAATSPEVAGLVAGRPYWTTVRAKNNAAGQRNLEWYSSDANYQTIVNPGAVKTLSAPVFNGSAVHLFDAGNLVADAVGDVITLDQFCVIENTWTKGGTGNPLNLLSENASLAKLGSGWVGNNASLAETIAPDGTPCLLVTSLHGDDGSGLQPDPTRVTGVGARASVTAGQWYVALISVMGTPDTQSGWDAGVTWRTGDLTWAGFTEATAGRIYPTAADGWHHLVVVGQAPYNAVYADLSIGYRIGSGASIYVSQLGVFGPPAYRPFADVSEGPCVQFQGETLLSVLPALPQPFTVAARFQWRDIGSTAFQTWFQPSPIDQRLLDATVYDWTVFFDGNGQRVGSSSAVADQWHTFIAVVNGAASHVYVDGVDATGNFGTVPISAGPVEIGASFHQFNGALRKLFVYNRALSDTERGYIQTALAVH